MKEDPNIDRWGSVPAPAGNEPHQENGGGSSSSSLRGATKEAPTGYPATVLSQHDAKTVATAPEEEALPPGELTRDIAKPPPPGTRLAPPAAGFPAERTTLTGPWPQGATQPPPPQPPPPPPEALRKKEPFWPANGGQKFGDPGERTSLSPNGDFFRLPPPEEAGETEPAEKDDGFVDLTAPLAEKFPNSMVEAVEEAFEAEDKPLEDYFDPPPAEDEPEDESEMDSADQGLTPLADGPSDKVIVAEDATEVIAVADVESHPPPIDPEPTAPIDTLPLPPPMRPLSSYLPAFGLVAAMLVVALGVTSLVAYWSAKPTVRPAPTARVARPILQRPAPQPPPAPAICRSTASFASPEAAIAAGYFACRPSQGAAPAFYCSIEAAPVAAARARFCRSVRRACSSEGNSSACLANPPLAARVAHGQRGAD